MFAICSAGEYDDATEIFWQLHPARKAKAALCAQLHGGAFINRQAWKFQAWLQGYNGGPLRQPTQRIHDAQMNALRKGLLDAGWSDGRAEPRLLRRPPSDRIGVTTFVSSEAVAAVLTWEDAIGAVRAAYAQPENPAGAPRRTVARGEGSWLRTLPAVPRGSRTFGAKLMGMSTTAEAPGVEYVIVLYDRRTSGSPRSSTAPASRPIAPPQPPPSRWIASRRALR